MNEKARFVEIAPYNPDWPPLFVDEKNKIQAILQDNCIEIHHIGSTAIPGMAAKPIIDIMPVVKDISLVDSLNMQFEELGYTAMGEFGIRGRRFFWKSPLQRTHHVHIFEHGSAEVDRHLAFKEFMLTHSDYANSYSVIKKNLASTFPYDIENYIKGKNSFIEMIDYQTNHAKTTQLNAKDKIVIESYDQAWPKLAAVEIGTIKAVTNLSYVAIEHLGSTAVPGLSSKPIIDIFISLASIEEAQVWIKPLESLGYIFWQENPDKTHYRFIKGMPPYGSKRTHHIHIVAADSNIMEHRVLFRDILRNNPEARAEYETLKLNLSQANTQDREAYTHKKHEFIKKLLRSYNYLKPIL